MQRTRDSYVFSDDPELLDRDLIHRFLANESYWARDIPRATLDRALANSLVFAVHREGAQVAFARVVTDRATFAWLADVFVVEEERGRGLGKWLMECLLEHPDLQRLRWFLLGTRDAHGLYRRFGFDALKAPERLMAIWKDASEIYGGGPQGR